MKGKGHEENSRDILVDPNQLHVMDGKTYLAFGHIMLQVNTSIGFKWTNVGKHIGMTFM
jgi:hypothetical protein